MSEFWSGSEAVQERVGRGTVVCGRVGTGILRKADTIAEVLGLLERDDLGETIALVESPSAGGIVPLLANIRGVVCRSGGLSSHLAVVAREFGILCVIGAVVDDADELEGTWIAVTEDGSLIRA